MRAVAWLGDQKYEATDIAEPAVEPGRVVVRVEATSICGSDTHLADFGFDPPVIPGHEAAGVVVAVGPGVDGVNEGDHVALDPVQRCGKCSACRSGIGHLCLHTRHLGLPGAGGTWADFVAVDAANAHRLPEGLNFDAAALVEPVAVCLESFRRARFEPGQRVLIVGDGPFGFLHAQLAASLGAATTIVAGHHDQRLQRIAATTSAVICNTTTRDLDTALADATDDGRVDLAIEASGAGPSPGACLAALRPRGTAVLFSYVWHPEPLDLGAIHMNELNVLGACRSAGEYPHCLDLIARGDVDTSALVDRVCPLSEAPTALAELPRIKSSVFKIVLHPEVSNGS